MVDAATMSIPKTAQQTVSYSISCDDGRRYEHGNTSKYTVFLFDTLWCETISVRNITPWKNDGEYHGPYGPVTCSIFLDRVRVAIYGTVLLCCGHSPAPGSFEKRVPGTVKRGSSSFTINTINTINTIIYPKVRFLFVFCAGITLEAWCVPESIFSSGLYETERSLL